MRRRWCRRCRVVRRSSRPSRAADGELVLPREPIAQALALDVGHHVEHQPRRFPRIVQRENVGVLQIGGGLDLGQESLASQDGGELGLEHLDRDLAVVAHSEGEAQASPFDICDETQRRPSGVDVEAGRAALPPADAVPSRSNRGEGGRMSTYRPTLLVALMLMAPACQSQGGPTDLPNLPSGAVSVQ